jgi:hypothetical protein
MANLLNDEDLKIYLTRIMELRDAEPFYAERIIKATINEIYTVGFAQGKEHADD